MKELGLNEEIALYQESQEVRRELGRVTLFAFVGPSGSGKDSIMNYLEESMPNRFAKVVGDTSRRRRKGEIDGRTYHFRTKKDMRDDLTAHNFVQVAPGSLGDFYGTRPGQYPIDKNAMMAVQARVMSKFSQLGFGRLLWLHIVPHSDEAWQQWQIGQGQSKDDERERLEEAISSYSLSLINRDTYYVLNDEIADAANRVVQISEGRRPADEQLAKKTATKNLDALKLRRQ